MRTDGEGSSRRTAVLVLIRRKVGRFEKCFLFSKHVWLIFSLLLSFDNCPRPPKEAQAVIAIGLVSYFSFVFPRRHKRLDEVEQVQFFVYHVFKNVF